MAEKVVSVIVPMYNAEETIEECLDSIIGQTIFDRMEVLIVDDASTDASVMKASAYEVLFPDQIALICLDRNAGPGNARNVAMEYASGDYIGFVDADDAIVPAMYEQLYEEAVRTGADVVDGGYMDQNTGEAIIYTSDDLIGELDGYKRSKLIVSGGFNVTKLFRRGFLIQNSISFRPAYVLEDMDYLIEVFGRAESIANVKAILYVYRNRPESLSKTMETGKYIESTSTALEAIYEKMSILDSYDDIRDACEYAMIQLYSYALNRALNAYACGEKDKEWVNDMVDNLVDAKARRIRGSYDNPFVKEKISERDIRIMRRMDESDPVNRGKAIDLVVNGT